MFNNWKQIVTKALSESATGEYSATLTLPEFEKISSAQNISKSLPKDIETVLNVTSSLDNKKSKSKTG